MHFVLRERYANRFLNEVNASPQLLELCGLSQVPTEGTYSRFKKALVPYRKQVNPLIADAITMLDGQIELLKQSGTVPADAPRVGEIIAFDATDVEAYGRSRRDRERRADQDAEWGYRTPKSSSQVNGEKEFFYGYKVHSGNDAYYWLPLYASVAPANQNEGPRFQSDLDELLKLHPELKPRYVLADKAYHAGYNFQHAMAQGVIPIIDIPRPPKNKDTGKRLHDGTYTVEGSQPAWASSPWIIWVLIRTATTGSGVRQRDVT